MGNGNITEKQSEILEYIKVADFGERISAGSPGNLRGGTLEVYFFCPLASGDAGEERVHPERPDEAACHRDSGRVVQSDAPRDGTGPDYRPCGCRGAASGRAEYRGLLSDSGGAACRTIRPFSFACAVTVW